MVIKLFYKDSAFIESESKDISNMKGVSATLVLDDDKKQAILEYSPDAPLIDKRTAERLANSICRSGYRLKSNRLVGANFNLKISSITLTRYQTTPQEPRETKPNENEVSSSPKESITDIYNDITEYFWVKMYGKSVSTWKALPEDLKLGLFVKINISFLKDDIIKELFDIRGRNDKKAFVTKLKLQT